MRTVSEEERTPFPELFDEGLKSMRRRQLRQEKYIELLEKAIHWHASCAQSVINTCYQKADEAANAQIEEEAK